MRRLTRRAKQEHDVIVAGRVLDRGAAPIHVTDDVCTALDQPAGMFAGQYIR